MRDSVKGLLALGIAVVVALLLWWQDRPDTAPVEEAAAPEPETTVAGGPAADPAPEPEPDPAPAAEPAPPVPPSFDVVRINAEGQAVIAGRAAPGEEVEIVLDGDVAGTAVADAQGEFAAVLDLAPSSEPRELVLRTRLGGVAGERVAIEAQEAPAPAEAEQVADQAAAAGDSAAGETAASETTSSETAAALTAAREAAEAAKREADEKAAAVAEAARAAEEKAEAAEKAARAAIEEKLDAEKEEAQRLAAETAEAARKAAEEAEAARKAAAEAEAARLAAEKAEQERLAAEKVEAERLAAEEAERLAATEAERAGSQPGDFVASAPVIILPREDADKAPLLIKPEKDDVTLLQPAETEPGTGVALDRITYTDQGDLIAAGRGAANTLIRIYANAVLKAEVMLDAGGKWEAKIDADIAQATQLLRFDVIDSTGKVVSRLETPFEYSPLASVQQLRDRKIVVQKGDYLWKFAEQYYGEGIRYSVIFSANSNLIRDPDLIYPGQVFTVPELVTSQ